MMEIKTEFGFDLVFEALDGMADSKRKIELCLSGRRA